MSVRPRPGNALRWDGEALDGQIVPGEFSKGGMLIFMMLVNIDQDPLSHQFKFTHTHSLTGSCTSGSSTLSI